MAKKSKKKTLSDNAIATSQQKTFPWNRDWLWGLALLVAVIVIYSPVWWAGFVWDDDAYVTDNAAVAKTSGLLEIWTTRAADICPLTMTTFWLEHTLWGLNPLGFHLVNVFIHAVNAIVLWRLLRLLQIPGAWLGAALWATHPVLVESVAWITELKNTQATFFYLLSILFFTRWLKSKASGESGVRDGNYGLTLLFALLAVASKTSTMVLPLILVLCAWWVDGRWQWKRLAVIAPTLSMAVGAGLLSLWTQGIKHAEWVPLSWPQRFVVAGDAIWFYLGKLLFPYPLELVYPRWQIDAGNPLPYLPLLAALILIVVFWLNCKTWGRPWFFTLAYFVTALLPVLGFVEHGFLGYSFVADHFQNLASMGPLALIASSFHRLSERVAGESRKLLYVTASVFLILLAGLSWNRAWAFENGGTLWTDDVAKNPGCWVGYYNLGCYLGKNLQPDKAIENFKTTIQLNPAYTPAHNALAATYLEQGRPNDAISECEKALQIDPEYLDALDNLGLALLAQGRTDEAVEKLRLVVSKIPNNAKVHYDLGIALVKQGQFDRAIAEYQTALQLEPDDLDALTNWGNILVQEGQLEPAIALYKKALEQRPDYAKGFNNLGLVLLREGRIGEAIEQFLKALEIDPSDDVAFCNLGDAYLQKGDSAQAIAQYHKALALNAGNAQAQTSLGNAFLQAGQIDEAIAPYRKALALNPALPGAAINLGVAYFRQGHFEQSATQLKEVVAHFPGSAEAHNNLGLALLGSGATHDAVAEFETALRLKPDYAEAAGNLARARH
jgi:tetratricopeptide (TPR) repeat protein